MTTLDKFALVWCVICFGASSYFLWLRWRDRDDYPDGD